LPNGIRRTLSGKVMPTLDGRDLIDFWDKVELSDLDALVQSLDLKPSPVANISADAIIKHARQWTLRNWQCAASGVDQEQQRHLCRLARRG
jgi:hypothetical protein